MSLSFHDIIEGPERATFKISNLGKEFSEVFYFSHTHTNTFLKIIIFPENKVLLDFDVEEGFGGGVSDPRGLRPQGWDSPGSKHLEGVFQDRAVASLPSF